MRTAFLLNIMVRGEKNFDVFDMQNNLIAVGETKLVQSFEEVFDAVLLGDTVLIVENDNRAVVISTKGWPSRGIPEAKTEVVVQGPKDAFTELGSMNTVLIRRRIRDTALKVRRFKCGRRSKTDIAVLYLKDVAKEELVENVISQIKSLDVDCILDSGYLEQFMEKGIHHLFHSFSLQKDQIRQLQKYTRAGWR